MKLIIQGDKIAALVGDDFPTADMLVAVPDGFDINQAHRYRYDVASGDVVLRVPASVTMRQARLALHANGLLASVPTAIAALPEPQRTQAQIEWDYSNGLERNNPFVATLGAALGLDGAGIDALFLQADAL